MSASGSIQSSDNNTTTDNTNDSAPGLNNASSQQNKNTHAYFIPVVMLVVLCVIIVATFYSKEFDNLITSMTSTDQDDDLNPAISTVFHATTDSLDRSTDSAMPDTAAADSLLKGSNKQSKTVIGPAVSSSTSTTAASNTTGVVADKVLPARSSQVASLENPAPYPARPNPSAYPYVPPMPYGMPEQFQQRYNEMMENRRMTEEKSLQAQREHLKKMQENRAAVMKRIEQDRRDRYLRMQELDAQRQKRQDELMERMEQVEKRAINRPI